MFLSAALILPQAAGGATLLVDLKQDQGNQIASTSTNFFANDANVDLSASVNNIYTTGGHTLGVFTVTLQAADGFFNTGNGAANDNLPILDGYWYTFQGLGTGRLLTIDGLSSIAVGDHITLTLYGASDNDTAVSSFHPTYGVTDLGTQAAGGVPSSRTTAFTFASTGADTLSILWGKSAGSGGAGFNGFSLTTTPVPEPSSAILLLLGAAIPVILRRRKS